MGLSVWNPGPDLRIGFPMHFFIIDCGAHGDIAYCIYGFNNFNPLRFVFAILFWYGVTVVIKRNESAS